jgi:hypothetical protein
LAIVEVHELLRRAGSRIGTLTVDLLHRLQLRLDGPLHRVHRQIGGTSPLRDAEVSDGSIPKGGVLNPP